MQQLRFKVGDKVKINSPVVGPPFDKSIGTIIQTFSGMLGFPYKIVVESNTPSRLFKDEELSAVSNIRKRKCQNSNSK